VTGRPTRLTALDAAFLHQEAGCGHMTVGGIATFDGPPPTIEQFRAHTLKRLHLIPRYRQRLRNAPSARPVWIDDTHFDVAYHVRRAQLPEGGGLDALWDLNAEIHAHRLDRSRPLWELYLVEGLPDGEFAVIARNHHALMDGVSNIDVLGALWDIEATEGPTPRDGDEDWVAEREPSELDVLGMGFREAAQAATGLIGGALGAVRDPGGTLARLRRGAEGVGEVVKAVQTPAPRTPFNKTIGPGREFTTVRLDLNEIKHIKNTLGGTVNDVMLDVVAGGIRELYLERGIDPAGVELRPVVPVSIRTEAEQGTLGNRVVTLRPALPIEIEDPVERLRAISVELDRCKSSTQPTVVEVLEGVMNWIPAPALGPVARLTYHPRLFNVLISNIPGPQFPLYLIGRKAKTMYAGGFLAQYHGLAIAAVSYDGGLGFGLMCDPSVVPELGVVAAGIQDTFDDLKLATERADGNGRPRDPSAARDRTAAAQKGNH
jgi:WS/DGAT/MGAT family acyltransferase